MACDTKSDLELPDHNSAVGAESTTDQMCLIKVLQMAIFKYKYSSEWKRLFKINLITVWAMVAVLLVSEKKLF